MSKFQVGDRVSTVDSRGFEWRVAKVRPDECFVVGPTGESGSAWFQDSELKLVEPSGPSVPDVDGNPIRPGQLVKSIEYEDLFRRAEEVDIDDGLFLAGNWTRGTNWRVVQPEDLLRPPEPETRDVELRVVLKGIPSAITHGDLAEGINRDLESAGVPEFTVEVVTPEEQP